ncbi:MAG: penicillin-binding protein 2 [Candidatus Peregrinibacteria bacterium]|nr:penicillin-binding protein 2 [Candidatus Peregrinibacteria bacterium]MDZ4245266.1 penicillin-binding protein 2 [Candidatus Gracilibacteria bacterium]
MAKKLRLKLKLNRIQVLMGLFAVLFVMVMLKVFWLQIVQYDYYFKIAQREHQGYAELPARRGEIYITEYHSGEEFKLATNTTLDLIYADPSLVQDSAYIAEKLAPILFDLEGERRIDEERIRKAKKMVLKELLPPEKNPETEEGVEEIKPIESTQGVAPKTDEELFNQFKHELTVKLSEKVRTQILLIQKVDPELKEKIMNLRLSGVEITESGDLYAYPTQIGDKAKTAKQLAPLTGFDKDILERLLYGKNRYTVLKKKLLPDQSDMVNALKKEDPENFIGIRLQEEYYRYYPEGQLAAQVLGYVNSANIGQYGIEGGFQDMLEGIKGYFTSQKDGTGSQITVGESVIKPAEDGMDIYLTIDRAIQLEVEKALEEGVKNAQADSGQAIVMDPKTGAILAMAQYPTFNPNEYGKAFEKKEIELTKDQADNLYVIGEGENQKKYLYIRKDPDERIQIFENPDTPGIYYTYANRVGPEVYKNKLVQEIYEPGSVFKAIAMASAIDAGEVTPNTTFTSYGPLKVDEFEIHTFDDHYYGVSTMTEVLVHSDNTGMAWVAQKLGRSLFYNYIKKFGFGKRTDIEFRDEEDGRVEYYKDWADSELATHGFGQGISATPLQVITGVGALANGGVLMHPHIMDKTINPATGEVKQIEPKKVERVISEESAKTITSMMVTTVEKGYPLAQVRGHYVAGKSGTSQTYKFGKALKGIGTTIGTFAGFAPIDDPQFIILIKMDHPKTSPWGAVVSAPVFKNIAEFIFTYYNIPPDKDY